MYIQNHLEKEKVSEEINSTSNIPAINIENSNNLQIKKNIHVIEKNQIKQEQIKLKQYICNTCGSIFKNKTSLNVHNSRSHSGSGKKPFVCSLCNKGNVKQVVISWIESQFYLFC